MASLGISDSRLQGLLLNVWPSGRYIPGPTGGGSKVEELESRDDRLICVGKDARSLQKGGADNGVEVSNVVERCLLLFSLRHPNVVQYLGLCMLRDSGMPTVVMEYMSHSLHQLLQLTVDIPLPVKRSILGDVARGLAYLHSHNPLVIHGKLTPTNILLTSAMTAKISDIGAMLHSDPNLSPHPPGLETSGCPYLPPEAAHTPFTTAVDVYSFGKIMFHTILQQLPGSSVAENSLTGQPEQLSTGVGSHPVEQVVDWCLQREPGRRPSAGQVLDVLVEGWVEVKCPCDQLTGMKMMVTAKLLEQSLSNHFQEAEIRTVGDHEGSENVGVAEVKTNQDIGADEPQSGEEGTGGDEIERPVEEDMDNAVNAINMADSVVHIQTIDAMAVLKMDEPEGGIQMAQVEVTDENSKNKLFQCKFCPASFSRIGNLRRHTRRHTGDTYRCETCQAGFTNASGLKRHMLIHTGEKPYHCKLCDAKFTQSGHLKEHVRTHTGEKPYQCKTCESRFTSSSDLRRHTRIHTGEKPHQCHVCEARFAQGSQLKEHLRVHTGGRPFECDVCEGKFTRASHLKRHKLIHNGEKPRQCQICSARFLRSGSLKRHMLTHTGEKLSTPSPSVCTHLPTPSVIASDENL